MLKIWVELIPVLAITAIIIHQALSIAGVHVAESGVERRKGLS